MATAYHLGWIRGVDEISEPRVSENLLGTSGVASR